VALAQSRNERAAIARTAVEAAEARLSLSRTAFLPRIDVVSGYRHDTDADTRNSLSAAANLTQPLFEPRAFPLVRQARFERDAAVLEAGEARRLIGFDAAAAYLSALGFDQVLLAARNRRDFARTNLEDVRARYEAGLVSVNDATKAELELATAERSVAAASGDAQDALVVLANIINTPAIEALAVPEELLTAASQAPAEADLDAAIERRPDIAATRARVEALRAFAEVPAAGFLPSLNLTAQTRDFNDGPVSNRDRAGSVGMTLNWSAFDAGIRRAQTAERNALLRGAELDLAFRRRDVERALRSATVQLTTEQASLRESVAAVRAARKNAEETGELYRQGLASALELADANQRLFDAQVAEVSARFRMATAFLRLREASGAEAGEK
jgi:outer membrane protein TolC